MNDQEWTDHVTDVLRALGFDEGRREEVDRELRRFSDMLMPVTEAKRSVVVHFGGDPRKMDPSKPIPIDSLEGNMGSVDVRGRVLRSEQRDVTVQGQARSITTGVLGDGTGTVRFTVWRPVDLAEGMAVTFLNAYTKVWNDRVELHLGERGEIRRADEDGLPPPSEETLPIARLQEGIQTFSLTARVVSMETRRKTVRGEEATLWIGELADSTGRIAYSTWREPVFKPGEVVRLTGCRLRRFRGDLELRWTKAERLADDVLPPLDRLSSRTTMTLAEGLDRGGARNMRTVGTILEVRNGSGLIFRCPECGRVTQDRACMVHGQVVGTPDLRTKAVLDDGTGAVTLVLDRQQTEGLLGMGLDDLIARSREQMDTELAARELEALLVATPVEVTGDLIVDDYGSTLRAHEVRIYQMDVIERCHALLQRLGGDA